MRTVLRLLVAVAVTLATSALLGFGTAAAESNGGVRIMPLGDSITDGVQTPGGYRIGLWQRFVANGYREDFVGSLSNGPAALGDHDHEGHSGWRIDQIEYAERRQAANVRRPHAGGPGGIASLLVVRSATMAASSRRNESMRTTCTW